MNKPSTWLALIAAVVYSGAYYFSNQEFDAMYEVCLKDRPTRERICLCERDTMSDEVSIYRVITAYSSEMERVKKFSSAACARVEGQLPLSK